jgi:hypothetical protein
LQRFWLFDYCRVLIVHLSCMVLLVLLVLWKTVKYLYATLVKVYFVEKETKIYGMCKPLPALEFNSEADNLKGWKSLCGFVKGIERGEHPYTFLKNQEIKPDTWMYKAINSANEQILLKFARNQEATSRLEKLGLSPNGPWKLGFLFRTVSRKYSIGHCLRHLRLLFVVFVEVSPIPQAKTC